MLLKSRMVVLFATVLLLSACGTFQRSSQNDTPAPTEQRAPADPLASATRNAVEIPGLFTIYQDTTSGSTKMMITYDQIGREFIYWGHTVDGPVAAGHYRGGYRENLIFSIQRHFDRIEFVIENTGFYFDEESPLHRAAHANIARAVVFSGKIEAEDRENGKIIINSDPLFLSEAMHQIKPSPRPGMPPTMFTLGQLSRDKTKFLDIRSYPENTAVVVEYIYDNPFPIAGGGSSVTDARSVAIQFQHSFIAMPDNDFRPRRDDARVGFFGQQVNDQTSLSPVPWRDVINRWHLVKQDPYAELSDPVEPITWWIENTTPLEIRDIIRDATLEWNKAFEHAGFTNAIQVKVQPDTADWDAGDIRYNVLRWTSSPQPPFAGYGPSFTNPRTGQILGADVMLEFSFLRNAIANEKLLTDNAMMNLLNMGIDHDHDHAGMYCSAGHFLHMNTIFGFAAARANGLENLDEEQLVHEAIYFLILHEVGHTLGLMHNMGSHNLFDPVSVHNAEVTRQTGLVGSVMDYPAINISLDPSRQGQFYTTTPGPYDIWAIQYGYSVALDDPEAEEARLTAILERSTEPELFFGNDADDMRSPGKAIDPRINVWAMTSDPIVYGAQRVQLSRQIMDNLLEKYSNDGESYQELYSAFMSTMAQINQAMGVTSRFIGGVYIDRAKHGQPGATRPYTPVSLQDQKRALASIRENLFAPNAFQSSHEVYSFLQRQRRGFNFFSTTEDPKIHDLALNMQRGVLNHIMHPVVLKRMTDSRLYGNEYSVAEFMGELTDAVFMADIRTNVNTFRQHLQVEYVTRLASVLRENNNPYDSVARSAALYNLENIKRMMENRSRGNAETRAHTLHILRIVNTALDV